MGKAKKKGLADKVRSRKVISEPKSNPFEVKFNRQKHDVLGKKRTKETKGHPGVSRAKAVKKASDPWLLIIVSRYIYY